MWDYEGEVTAAEAARIIGVSTTYLSGLMRRKGLPSGQFLPLRMYAALSPRFAERLARREDDRSYVTERLSALEKRVAQLESAAAGLESELAVAHALFAKVKSAPVPAPHALDALGLPGLSKARPRK